MKRLLKLALVFSMIGIAPAHAADKAAKTRVAEAFQLLPREMIPHAVMQRAMMPRETMPRIRIRIPRVQYYYFDHPVMQRAGRAIIVKECPIDIQQDPGEHSCKIAWAKI